jgi:glycine betaine/proline transport system permease protein
MRTPAATVSLPSARLPSSALGAPGLFAAVAATALALAALFPWAAEWPAEWTIPLADWVTAGLHWLARDFSFGLFTFRDLTRGLASLLTWPLDLAEGLLFAGFKRSGIPPIPWIAVAGGVVLLGHFLGGRRLALLCAVATLYLAIFGLWADSMRTLSLVIVTVPLAALAGLVLGVLAFKSARADRILRVLFDLMQAVPHLAYLAPVAVFFGFGPVAAMIASGLFALAPMARAVILGLRTIPPNVVEAGLMCGCTPRQLLWRTQLPAAMPAVLVGLNQVVMQVLAMAVIASLIGATGLGHRLLVSLQQLQLGRAVEFGVAIVLIAIVLDRLTQAWARRTAVHRPHAAWGVRHRHSVAFLALLVAAYALTPWLPLINQIPKSLTVTTAPFWDQGVRWISVTWAGPLSAFRDGMTIYVLLPVRNAFLWLPWPLLVGIVGAIAWRLGGWRLTLLSTAMIGAILLVGLWTPAMMTLYLTTLAVIVCILIGVPLGVVAARRPRAGRAILTLCDTLQTFPSFIYLIPVIMLFRVGDLASLIAIVGYAMVPIIRFTHLGITRIPANVGEAAIAAGATPRQLLWKVQLPLSLPEIMLGVNQTILMALAMTAITALIGSRDLGQEILKALPEVDTGRGLLAGLAIAFIGIIADRLVAAWIRKRGRRYGFTQI